MVKAEDSSSIESGFESPSAHHLAPLEAINRIERHAKEVKSDRPLSADLVRLPDLEAATLSDLKRNALDLC